VTERPLCSCHGEPMSRHGRKPDGSQRWRCAVKHRSQQASYQGTEKGRAVHRAGVTRYRSTAKGRAVKRAADSRYQASPSGRAANTRYDYSLKGQETRFRAYRHALGGRIGAKAERAAELELELATLAAELGLTPEQVAELTAETATA
jgi:hypothetical protein